MQGLQSNQIIQFNEKLIELFSLNSDEALVASFRKYFKNHNNIDDFGLK